MPQELVEAKILDYGKLSQIYSDILYQEKYRQALRKLGSDAPPSNLLKNVGPFSNMRLGPLDIVDCGDIVKIPKINVLVKVDEKKGKPLYAIVDFSNGIKVYLGFEIEQPIVGIDIGIRHLFTIVAIIDSGKLYKVKFIGDKKMVDVFSKFLGDSQGLIYINKIKERSKKPVTEAVEFLEEIKPRIIAIEDLRLYDEKVGKGLRAIQEILEQELFKRGMKVRRLDPRNTSKICSRCGYKKGEVLGSIFVCPSCGYKADRDFNAAYNIALKCYYTC
ncbi:zinc ribbon domain-containing protein [Acidianus manzaensis]|uniref:Transposase n=1 Tax=Acidianus manzaensis TaxID=282676 RepID=A0A1W6K158_9CREN|nr:zinc ribbon domain-containing protein [Acidianus manzaensis]ARM76210.1 transposase [Acidianus manzaensis]